MWKQTPWKAIQKYKNTPKTIYGSHKGDSNASSSRQQNARKTGSVLIDNKQKHSKQFCMFPNFCYPQEQGIYPLPLD